MIANDGFFGITPSHPTDCICNGAYDVAAKLGAFHRSCCCNTRTTMLISRVTTTEP
jgi:hypothetical protein